MGTLGAHKMQTTVSQDWHHVNQVIYLPYTTGHCLVLAHTIVDTEPLLRHNFGSAYTGVPS